MSWTLQVNTDALNRIKKGKKGEILSDADLAERIGVAERTITRVRAGSPPREGFIGGMLAVYGNIPDLYIPVRKDD